VPRVHKLGGAVLDGAAGRRVRLHGGAPGEAGPAQAGEGRAGGAV
jgi:hypothetical protein